MIAFSCPKCGKQFRVPDTAVGQHGWCKGCGTIIRVPGSSSASPDDIVDVKIDPQVEALLRHMASQLKEQRARAKEIHAELRAVHEDGERVAVQERMLSKTEHLSRKLASHMAALEKERQSVGGELRETLHALQALLKAGISRQADEQPLAPSREANELREDLERERAGNAAAIAQVHELETRLSAAAKESESRAAELTRLQERLTRSEERMAELAERCGKLEEQATVLRRERDEFCHKLENREVADQETEAVTARLQEKESAIQRLTGELRTALETKGELEAVSRQRLDDIEHLSAELSGVLQSAESEIAEIQKELRAEREAHLLAERALVENQEELRSVRRDLDALRAVQGEKNALDREVSVLRQALLIAGEAGHERRSPMDETEGELQDARDRIRALESELAQLREVRLHIPEIESGADEESEAAPQTPEQAAMSKDGPFPGPFVRSSEQEVDVQGIALIPEVIDDTYDDREMLDTLMRFLGPE